VSSSSSSSILSMLEDWPPPPCFPFGYYLYLYSMGFTSITVPNTNLANSDYANLNNFDILLKSVHSFNKNNIRKRFLLLFNVSLIYLF
jgi:hypothetical protein